MPGKTLKQVAENLGAKLNDQRGKAGGYPGDFEYSVIVSANSIEISLKDAEKKGDKAAIWRRSDPWGLAIVYELEEILLKEGLPRPAITLTIVMRQTTSSTKPYFEALLRRISYLSHINDDIKFFLFVGNTRKTLYTESELADRKSANEVVRGSDYAQRHDSDLPGRLEKDFQTYLFGKGLYDNTVHQNTNTPRSNIRLGLLGSDFAEGDKSKTGALEREFPTGAFLGQKSSKTRVLPTWYIDLLTMNKHGQIAAIELKFHNNKNVPALDVLAQVLDYALFFHCYREQLQPTLKERIRCNNKDTPVVMYFVSNMHHSKFKSVCKRYTKGKLEIKFIQMGYMWE